MKKALLISILFVSSIAAAQDCIDFSQYDQSYLDSLAMAPAGTVAFNEGNLSIIKGQNPSFFINTAGDTLWHVGNLMFDVSAETCANKQLTFSCFYLEALAVDGDTIFTALQPPAFYSGNGFTFECITIGNYKRYTISGDFDLVSLMTQTNILWDVCLECTNTGGGAGCINFAQYDQSHLDSLAMAPAGTVAFSDGNLSIIKGQNPSFFIQVTGDSLFYVGNIQLDASAEICPNKQLTFSSVYLEGLAVDGDTLFTFLNPPASYSGNGFTFEYVNVGNIGQYTITGDFDIVSLMTQTNILWDVCLECLAGIEPAEKITKLSVYPNPVIDGKLTIAADHAERYFVYDLNGNLLLSESMQENVTLDVSNLQTGMYLIKITDDSGNSETQKIIVD